MENSRGKWKEDRIVSKELVKQW